MTVNTSLKIHDHYPKELLLYIRHYASPKLRQLLRDNPYHRSYIWIGALCAYHRLDDVDEVCERWSSLRNSRFVSPHSHDPEQMNEFVNQLFENFIQETMSDIDDMSNFIGSSWIYDHVRLVHYTIHPLAN